jgi:hypothetical protein
MDEEFFWRVLQADIPVARVSAALGAFRVQSDAKTFGHSREAWTAEREGIYDRSTYDRYLPKQARTQIARAAKGVNLIRDGRWDAFKSRLS